MLSLPLDHHAPEVGNQFGRIEVLGQALVRRKDDRVFLRYKRLWGSGLSGHRSDIVRGAHRGKCPTSSSLWKEVRPFSLDVVILTGQQLDST